MTWDSGGIMRRLEASLEHARSEGHRVAVAVVDAGGHLIAFLRDPDARLVTVTTAIGKGRCAILYDRDTSHTVELAQRNPVAFDSFVAASELAYVIGGGGFLVEVDGSKYGVGLAGASGGADDTLGQRLATELADELAGATRG